MSLKRHLTTRGLTRDVYWLRPILRNRGTRSLAQRCELHFALKTRCLFYQI